MALPMGVMKMFIIHGALIATYKAIKLCLEIFGIILVVLNSLGKIILNKYS